MNLTTLTGQHEQEKSGDETIALHRFERKVSRVLKDKQAGSGLHHPRGIRHPLVRADTIPERIPSLDKKIV